MIRLYTKWMMVTILALVSLGSWAGDGDGECKHQKTKSDQTQAQTDKTGEQKTANTGSAGMIYTTEQNRGEAEVPAELRSALAEMVNTSSEGLVEQELEDGTVIVDLQGRFQSAMVVSVGEDGKLTSGCYSTVPGHKCEKKHVAAKATSTTTEK